MVITLDNYFDKIFYINMDEDIDRDNHIRNQFEKYNISNIERISGTKLQEIPHIYLWRNFNKNTLNEKYILGSLGCRNSHWRIMQICMERGYEKVAIFEDDVIFTENPNEVLSNTLSNVHNWDIMYFGGTEEHHYRSQIVGAFAYAVNRKMIEEIYYMLPSSGMEVDNFYAKILFHMSYNYSDTGKYKIVKTSPFNSVQVDFSYQSNIR